jgi:RNA polymerase sigma-70 factor, ECF subfamily
MSGSLRERLLAAVDGERRAALATIVDLEARLAGWLEAARVTHGLAVDEARMLHALAHAIEVPVGELDAGDLWLATACAHGDPAALRRFDAVYGRELDRAIAKSRGLGLSPAEFRQLVRDRLFVRDGDRPARIASYRGRGTLKAWVRVMTSRLVVDLARRHDDAVSSDDALADKIQAADDPEIDYLRHAYGSSLDAAFAHAIDRLTVRQRNLLRQRYLHGVSPDALAKIYAVHRSTLFDWLEKARAAMLRHVREGLATRVPGDALESVVHLLGSKLDVSVRRMLDSRIEPEPGEPDQ